MQILHSMLQNKRSKLRNTILFFGIVIFTIIIYLPAIKNGFLNWDDNWYITNNSYISDFSLPGIINMFTHLFHSQYSPLVMVVLSFLKYAFGLNPIPFHLTSLIFHIINAWLVFRFIDLLTGKTNLALLISAFFAIHPFQVESVAWMSAMKIVLSSSLFLLSLIYYIKFNKSERILNYYLSILFFILALLSKEQTLILPLAIIIVDYFQDRKLLSRKVILEKIPYIFLSALFLVVTLAATYTQGFKGKMPSINIFYQIEIVLYSLFDYLSKLIIPVNLSSFYPYPTNINYLVLLVPVLLTAIVLFALIKKLISQKELIFSVGFFLVNIIITLQFVQVRKVYMADRYMYLPLLGILLIFGFIFYRLIVLNKKYRYLIIPFISVVFLLFSTLSYTRAKVWNNSFALWDEVINKTGESYFPLLKRGQVYLDEENYDMALSDFNKSIELNSRYYVSYENRGYIYSLQEDYDKAILDFEKSLELSPESSYSYCSLGFVYLQLENYEDALINLNKAIENDEEYVDAYKSRGEVFIGMEEYDKACPDLEKAISLGLSEDDTKEAQELKSLYCE